MDIQLLTQTENHLSAMGTRRCMNRRKAIAFGAALLASLATFSHAQDYPNRPIRLVVPFPAGAGMDAIARRFSEGLGRRLGQAIIVDNKPGGNLIPATIYNAKAAPDGYTLFFMLSQPYTVNQFLFKKLPYDAAKDFTPIGTMIAFTTGIQVPSDSPFKNLKEFVEAALASPEKMNFGSAGTATQNRLSMEIFAAATKIKLTHVPYQGSGPATIAMLAGQVDAVFSDYGTIAPHLKAHKARGLAINLPKRLPGLPDVPTFAEAGYKDLHIPLLWTGMVAPPNMSPQLAAKLSAAVVAEAGSTEMRKFADEQNMIVMPAGAGEMRTLIEKDIEAWGGMVQKLKITID